MSLSELLKIAKKYLQNAYCPYSKLRICAVLVGQNDVYAGVNVENSSLGLTMCAERIAIFKAISEGERQFSQMLIYSPDIMPYPCGACRQVMSEFCQENFKITVSNGNDFKVFKLKNLLPFSFSSELLHPHERGF